MNATIEPGMSVGQVVSQFPATARVFEKYRIDYCCAGRVPLAAACDNKRADQQLVIAELNAVVAAGDAGETNWSESTLTALCDHIEQTHHAYLKTELPRLRAIIAKVVRSHGDNHPELAHVEAVYLRFAEELFEHMAKEERILFPALRRMEATVAAPPARLDQPIACMMQEHDSAGAALAEMRCLTNGYQPPMAACATYRVMLDSLSQLELDMHTHVHKENSILFPKALGTA